MPNFGSRHISLSPYFQREKRKENLLTSLNYPRAYEGKTEKKSQLCGIHFSLRILLFFLGKLFLFSNFETFAPTARDTGKEASRREIKAQMERHMHFFYSGKSNCLAPASVGSPQPDNFPLCFYMKFIHFLNWKRRDYFYLRRSRQVLEL